MTENRTYTNEMAKLAEIEARCHNTWKDVVLLSVASIAFLFSGFFPYLIIVAVVCMLLFVFSL